MVGPTQQKILGACVLGVALVAAAYTLTNFGIGKALPASVGAVAAPARVAVKVEDKDNNGIEDWRDTFYLAQPAVLSTIGTSSEYTVPTTQTSKVAITLLENSIRAKNSGAFGASREVVVNDALSQLNTEIPLYGIKDVIVMETWTDSDIKTYANTLAQIILNGKNPAVDGEMAVLRDVVYFQKQERAAELQAIAENYKTYSEQTKDLPVPKPFLKQHLDLLNTYQALHQDVDAFAAVGTDPLRSLVHLRRYTDDATGLALALRNINTSLNDFSSLFTAEDPALIFSMFDPNYTQP